MDYSMDGLYDCKELRQMIIENPDLPLLVFVGEEAYCDRYSYSCPNNITCSIDDLYLYRDLWLSKDEFEERLQADMENDDYYSGWTDEQFFNELKEWIEKSISKRAICVWCS